jgi:hypothetical protein
MVRVFVWQNLLQWSRSGLEPDPEWNREFGPVANTGHSGHMDVFHTRLWAIGLLLEVTSEKRHPL